MKPLNLKKPGKPVTGSEEKRIKALAKTGLSIARIAKKANRAKSTVFWIVGERPKEVIQRIKSRAALACRSLPKEKVKRVVALLKSPEGKGISLKEAARKTGVWPDQIKKICAANGLQVPNQQNPQRKPKELKPSIEWVLQQWRK